MNRYDVIDVLTAVSAADRRTVGDADVDVWEAVIGDLPVDKALQAVRDHFRNKPGVWIEPGHVYQGARAIMRDELDRHPEQAYAANAARAEGLAAKAIEDAEALAERKGLPGPVKFKRNSRPAALKYRCPWCKAAPGSQCVTPMTRFTPAGGIHPTRTELAIEKADT